MKSRRNDEFSVAELVPLGSIVEDLVASSFFPRHDDLRSSTSRVDRWMRD